jgi:hypothetical protein
MQAFAPSRGVDLTHQSLQKSIKLAPHRGGKDTSLVELRLQMGWWGRLTQEFHNEGMDAGEGHAFKIVLPGGGVIFRRRINGATRRAFSSAAGGRQTDSGYFRQEEFEAPPVSPAAAKERMDWMKDAYKAVRYGKDTAKSRHGEFTISESLEQLTGNLAAAILTDPNVSEIFESVDIELAAEQAYRGGKLSGEIVTEVGNRLEQQVSAARKRTAYAGHVGHKNLSIRQKNEAKRRERHRQQVKRENERRERERKKREIRKQARNDERNKPLTVRRPRATAQKRPGGDKNDRIIETYTGLQTLKEAYWGHVRHWNVYGSDGRPARHQKAWRAREHKLRTAIRHLQQELQSQLND